MWWALQSNGECQVSVYKNGTKIFWLGYFLRKIMHQENLIKLLHENHDELAKWHTDREIGKAFEKTLDLTRTAWDVYLVYEPGITWDGELPPPPSYWMHQLTEDSGADQQYCLNPVTLTREVEKRLEKTN